MVRMKAGQFRSAEEGDRAHCRNEGGNALGAGSYLRAQILQNQQVHKSMIGRVRVKKDLADQGTVTPARVGAFKGEPS